MKKIGKILFVILAIISFGYMAYSLTKGINDEESTVKTDSLIYTSIEEKTVAAGSIVPRKEIQVKSNVSGVVGTLFVEPGQIVKTGDKIAKIKIIPNMVTLNNAEARVEQALINFKNAQREFERQKALYEQKVISNFEFNKFQLDYNLQKQTFDAAKDNLSLVRDGAKKQSTNTATIVRATSDGMILDVPVKEGSFVIESNTFNDGTTIANIANMNDLIFEGKVDEAEVGKLKEGINLKLDVGALEGDNYKAKLEYISPKGVDEQGAIKFKIKASLQLDDKYFLRAGYSANADIIVGKKDSVLALKEKNLIFEDDKVYAKVKNDDNEEEPFKKTEVKTGISDGIYIEILDGLKEDDKVMVL